MATVDLRTYDGVLVDAFGVLYNQSGGFSESTACIQALISAGKPVVVVTNNTSVSPETISARLHAMQMPIEPSYIISSGRGLAWDSDCRSAIEGRAVFFLGPEDASGYVTDAGGRCVCRLTEADVIVLACTASSEKEYQLIIKYKKQEPHVPIFCINPDRYIQVQNQRVPVIGYFSERIEHQSGPVHWMGKPMPAFSSVVDTYCQTALGLSLGPNWVFVDDNPDNVSQLTQDLGICGLVPIETGLAQSWPTPLPQSNSWNYIQRLSIQANIWYDGSSKTKS